MHIEHLKYQCIPYVCPPGLHITLSIFYRLWTLLETACHELDLELATRTSPRPTDRKSFQHYSALVKQLAKLNEKKTGLLELTSALNSRLADLAIQIPDAESHPRVQMLMEEALSSARKLNEIVRICSMGGVRQRKMFFVSTGERDQGSHSQLQQRVPCA